MGSSTFIDNSVFMRNGAVFGGAIDMNMDDIRFADEGSVRGGMDGELIINKSVFEKDTAKYGGALSSFGGSLYQSTNGGSRGGPCFSSFDIEIDSSSFIDCDAKFAGGAIYNQLGMLVTNSSFERDTAGEIGGAIFTGEFSNDHATYGKCGAG
jgi:predicted outer membrane repeat protein